MQSLRCSCVECSHCLFYADDEATRLQKLAREQQPGRKSAISSAEELRMGAIMKQIGELQMVTVFSSDGNLVIHQNQLSLRHLGQASNSSDIITNLFSFEPTAYRSMMSVIKAGGSWKQGEFSLCDTFLLGDLWIHFTYSCSTQL